MDQTLMGLAEEMKSVRAQMRQLAQDRGKPMILEALQPLWDLGVDVVRWRQYTPYFNDGDACEFSVGDPYVLLSGAKDVIGDYEDGFLSSWDFKYYKEDEFPNHTKEQLDKVAEALEVFAKAICSTDVEPFMEDLFGDHAEVTVYADGRFDVDDYSHD